MLLPPLDLRRERRDINSRIAERTASAQSLQLSNQGLLKTREELNTLLEAQKCVQTLAQEMQQKSHRRMAAVVSKCLSSVFDEPHSLRVDFEQRRGRTEADFTLVKEGRRMSPATTSGGVRDVVSIALRLVQLTMSSSSLRFLLVLDEPFKGVSLENTEKMAALLQSLTKDLAVQFIIVTHNQFLQIGNVVQL